MERTQFLSFITIAAGFVLTQFSLILYLPSQHLIAESIGLNPQEMAYALSTALCGYAAGQLFWGTLSDFFGRKNALLTAAISGGITAFAIPNCHSAANFDLLLATLTFFQAAYNSIGYALIYDTFPPAKTAKIIATISIFMAITPVIAPRISLTITDNWGWTMLFKALSVYSLLLSLGIMAQIKRRRVSSVRPKLTTGFASLMRNWPYLRYCLTLALAFSTFILFQQNAKPIFTQVMQVNDMQYATLYALAASPYLLSTIAVRKWIQRIPVKKLTKTGTGFLVTGYLTLLIGGLFPDWALSQTFGWLGVMISMIGTGIVMPGSKIGAISSVNSQVGSASSGMKFIQIGSSIVVTWIAADIMDTQNITNTLWVLAGCAVIAAALNYLESYQAPQETLAAEPAELSA